MKMISLTKEQVEQAYQAAKKVSKGRISAKDAAKQVHEQCGMNEGTAKFFISAFPKLLTGQLHTRGFALMPMSVFLTNILADYKEEGLSKALKSLMHYIEHHEEAGRNKQGLKNIHKEHLAYLNS